MSPKGAICLPRLQVPHLTKKQRQKEKKSTKMSLLAYF